MIILYRFNRNLQNTKTIVFAIVSGYIGIYKKAAQHTLHRLFTHILVAECNAQSLCGLDELVVGRDEFCFACDF